MTIYYLTLFKNDRLNSYSPCTRQQQEVFLVDVSKDHQEALDVLNEGRLTSGAYGVPHTLPTANSAHWAAEDVLTFDRLQSAYRTARFLEACAKRPTQLPEIKDQMRKSYSDRFPENDCPFTYWNRTERIRYVHDAPVLVVSIMARLWAASRGLNAGRDL